MTYSVAGVNFAHFHMGDHLRQVEANPNTELVAICDEDPETATLGLDDTANAFSLDDEQVYRDHEACLNAVEPDIVVTCPTTADHAEWVERLAPFGADIVLEKPFAATLSDADRILKAVESAGIKLVVNWPLVWYPVHRTTKRLVDEGTIGAVEQVHYYDGNRGSHRFTDVGYTEDGEMHFSGAETDGAPAGDIWFHDPNEGGGSMLDYLGYGVTLGTWFRDGDLPVAVTAETYSPDWSSVDQQSLTIARYDEGLSKYETSWSTFTDPWVTQPQPNCGFVLRGERGTIGSFDYEDSVRVQTTERPEGYEVPIDELDPPFVDCWQYLVHCLDENQPVSFPPLEPTFNRRAQRIVESARLSVERGETVPLVDNE